MPSLYHHEKLTPTYATLDDDTLWAYHTELKELQQNTEIPRQLGVISVILARLEFELEYRMHESEPSV